ncbi:MAG: hypothetical protein ACK5Q5_16980, partial [Planctomycetaceae bacterium]
MKSLFNIVAAGLTLSVAAAAGELSTPADRATAVGLQFGPDTTVITQPRTADGLPDYVAALNQQLSAGVSREDNFWVLMWPALGNAERSSEEYIRQVERQLGVTIQRQSRIDDP